MSESSQQVHDQVTRIDERLAARREALRLEFPWYASLEAIMNPRIQVAQDALLKFTRDPNAGDAFQHELVHARFHDLCRESKAVFSALTRGGGMDPYFLVSVELQRLMPHFMTRHPNFRTWDALEMAVKEAVHLPSDHPFYVPKRPYASFKSRTDHREYFLEVDHPTDEKREEFIQREVKRFRQDPVTKWGRVIHVITEYGSFYTATGLPARLGVSFLSTEPSPFPFQHDFTYYTK